MRQLQGQLQGRSFQIRETEHIATRLRHTREAFGVNQREFARRANLKQNRYSQYESGARPLTIDAANKICDEYGVSLDWLYRGDLEPQRRPLRDSPALAGAFVCLPDASPDVTMAEAGSAGLSKEPGETDAGGPSRLRDGVCGPPRALIFRFIKEDTSRPMQMADKNIMRLVEALILYSTEAA